MTYQESLADRLGVNRRLPNTGITGGKFNEMPWSELPGPSEFQLAGQVPELPSKQPGDVRALSTPGLSPSAPAQSEQAPSPFGPDPSAFTQGVQQRGQQPGFTTGGAWKGAGMGALSGATSGAVAAGVGAIPMAVLGAFYGGIKGAIQKKAKSAATDYYLDDARGIIGDAHQQYMGRELSPQDLDGVLRGQGWESGDQYVGKAQLDYVLDQFRQNGAREAAGRQTPQTALAEQLTAPPAPGPTGGYQMRGFDAGKLADSGHNTEKYQIGRIMQRYDPKGGVTPEMLAELNALGLAEFSGSGDKLTVNNTKNDPRFGKGGTADVVYGLKGQNADTAWQPWFIDEGGGEAAAAPAGGGGARVGGGMNLDSLLTQDPYSNIAAGLGKYTGQGDYLRSLLAKLNG